MQIGFKKHAGDFFFVLALAGCVHASPPKVAETCEFNPSLQKEKSAQLRQIQQEDQDDRAGTYDSIDWDKVTPRDLQRRIKVAQIFAEGCLATAADFGAAAIVYQHGTTAGHYYQAFVWANEAVKLGDEKQKWLTAAALDRYLVKVGNKQLFGTQFSKDPAGKWCIQAVEPSFPDKLRIQYVKSDVKDQTKHVLQGIGAPQSVNETKDCLPALKASPRGTVPGFW